jgi:hypothetical protein
MAESVFKEYLDEVSQYYSRNIATEHAYRGTLQKLIEKVGVGIISATNESKRIKCGAPDYVVGPNSIL